MEKQSISKFQQFSERGFAKVNVFTGSGNNTFVLNLKPGQQMPAHFHPGAELFFFVFEGNGTFSVNGEKHEVATHDCLHVLGTEKVGFINTGSVPASVYVALCKLSDVAVGDNC